MHHGSKYSPSEGPRSPQSPLASWWAGGASQARHCVRLHVCVISCDGEFVSPSSRVVCDGEAVDTITCNSQHIYVMKAEAELCCVGQILQDFVDISDTFLTQRHRLLIRHPSSVWATSPATFHSPSVSPPRGSQWGSVRGGFPEWL